MFPTTLPIRSNDLISNMQKLSKAVNFIDTLMNNDDRAQLEQDETHVHNDLSSWPNEELEHYLDELDRIRDEHEKARPELIRAGRRIALTNGVIIGTAVLTGLFSIAGALLYINFT